MDESSLDKPVAKVPLTKTVPAEPALRASDADRDRIADILREALAEGRLTAGEHAERIEGVYSARTVAELEPLVRDLPAGRQPAAEPASSLAGSASPAEHEPDNLLAIFGGSVRKGRWRVRARTNVVAVCGGVELDLTEASFQQQRIVINAFCLFGGMEIKLPENVAVRSTGTGIFGGFDVETRDAPDPRAPVIVITGFAIFGGVSAKSKRGKRVKDLRAEG